MRHRGSGKTTELKRLAADEAIGEKFLPIYLTIQEFGSESVHLSHDALMVEIGLALGREGQRRGMDTALHENLANWGKEIVRTFLHDEAVQAEVGAKANAWLACSRRSSARAANGRPRRNRSWSHGCVISSTS